MAAAIFLLYKDFGVQAVALLCIEESESECARERWNMKHYPLRLSTLSLIWQTGHVHMTETVLYSLQIKSVFQ